MGVCGVLIAAVGTHLYKIIEDEDLFGEYDEVAEVQSTEKLP